MTKPITDLKCPNCGFVHSPDQNTLCTYSDERGQQITRPTVSEVLFDSFGFDFAGATQDQRLLLLEAVVLSLRTGGWQHKLHLVCCRTRHSQRLPDNCFSPTQLGRNEGLKLVAVLNVAIIEGYTAEAFNKREATAKTSAVVSEAIPFFGSEGVDTAISRKGGVHD